MQQDVNVNFGNLLLSLSDAMNLALPDLASHGIRTAFVAWRTGRGLGLEPGPMGRLVAAALLHDLGAISVEEQERLLANEEREPEIHCIRGAVLLDQAGLLRGLAPVVRHHHRPLEEWGGAARTEEFLLAQILLLADQVDRSLDREVHILQQSEAVRNKVRTLAPATVLPDVAGAFLATSEAEEFWLTLRSRRLYSTLLHEGPIYSQQVGMASLLEITGVFRDIVDFRSRFTSTHSSGVARSAVLLATILGMTEPELRLMQVAGDVHDLGKLAIPNRILEKQGGLTAGEFQIMKQHTYYTFTILDTIGGLRQVPQWAAFHHERLDGKGYPFRLDRESLDTGARIMAVADTFTALAEDRPYRPAMDSERIAKVLAGMAEDDKLDRRLTRLLLDHMGDIRPRVRETQAAARDFYETRFAVVG
ncbi:MAG: HD domain-containing protein [Lentisphaeria bacterium]|jgi:HD-GYP domain-containing protein (c-di-GMP phosphodiesterase class II)|nr:HD domain-containing protein [Lentisphaeria bacterium]